MGKERATVLRLGRGSLGGKARGLVYASELLARHGLDRRFPGLPIRVPRSLVIPTEEYERFMEACGMSPWRLRAEQAGGDELLLRALSAPLRGELSDRLGAALRQLRGPLAVRSSSLLEDGQRYPFAGVYATYMLTNNYPAAAVRLRQAESAVKAVFASALGHDARNYIAATPFALEEERMAVLLQEVVGSAHGGRFYPAISGVALSINDYAVGRQRAEEGVALLALGLGHGVAEGGTALRFSPAHPRMGAQLATARELLAGSQRNFVALDLRRALLDFTLPEADSALVRCELSDAEADGTLALVGSTWHAESELLRDDLLEPGPRLVTFNAILKWGALPLAEALCELLHHLADGLGSPVELEFALELSGGTGGWNGVEAALYLLQVRPQSERNVAGRVETRGLPREALLCATDRSVGHGLIEGVRDIVYVKPGALDARAARELAHEVGALNGRLHLEERPYVLIGPGRWGSSDPSLGIPVRWGQISGARVVVETSYNGRELPPSQGSHFFHNLIAARMGYLSLSHQDRLESAEERFVDWAWLVARERFGESARLAHVRLEAPLEIRLDGRAGRAAILKPRRAKAE